MLVSEPGHEPIVLRIYHPGNRPEVEIQSELAWMRALRDQTSVRVRRHRPHAGRP